MEKKDEVTGRRKPCKLGPQTKRKNKESEKQTCEMDANKEKVVFLEFFRLVTKYKAT